MIYASKEEFGGQRASVGRAVLVVSPPQRGSFKPGHGESGDTATEGSGGSILPGTIEEIARGWGGTEIVYVRLSNGGRVSPTFALLRDEAALLAYGGADCWTWPPRV